MSNYSLWCDLWTSWVTLSLNSYRLKTTGSPMPSRSQLLPRAEGMMQNPQHTTCCWCSPCKPSRLALHSYQSSSRSWSNTWARARMALPFLLAHRKMLACRGLSQHWNRIHTRQWGLKVIWCSLNGQISIICNSLCVALKKNISLLASKTNIFFTRRVSIPHPCPQVSSSHSGPITVFLLLHW